MEIELYEHDLDLIDEELQSKFFTLRDSTFLENQVLCLRRIYLCSVEIDRDAPGNLVERI
jgi:uncharacterized protein Yka (UPF0111/DUF47 family)